MNHKQFYFQPRRGKLDLKAISKVDLEKLIKDVDIDILQVFLENITFSNIQENDLRFLTDALVIKLFRLAQMTIEYLLYAQEELSESLNKLASKYSSKKRILMKKRKQLLELQEATNFLKGEVKAKKNGINTLETLLKDAHRSNGNSNTLVADSKVSSSRNENNRKDDKINYFITCNDGLCVEFINRMGTKVWEVKADVRKAFVSRRDYPDKLNDDNIKIIFKGKLLLDDSSLCENGVKSGDTLNAIINQVESINKDIQPNSQIEEMIKKQQEALSLVSLEIKKDLEDAINSFHSSRESISKETTVTTQSPDYNIDQKLNQFETRISNKLEQKLNSLNFNQEMKTPSHITRNYFIKPGELESDDDVYQEEIKSTADNEILSELSALKETVGKQVEEIEYLKSKINSINHINIDSLVQLSTTTTIVESSNQVKPADTDNDMNKKEKAEIITPMEEIATIVDSEPKVEIVEQSVIIEPIIVEQLKEQKPKAPTPEPPSIITFKFSSDLNPDLNKFSKSYISVDVEM